MATTSPITGVPLPSSGDTDQVPADLMTAFVAAEKMFVMPFANSAARASKITSPSTGMLTWLTSPGRYEEYSGSAWVPLVRETWGPDITAIAGANWDGVSPTTTYHRRANVVIGASSLFTVTLATAFPNGLLSVSMFPGDNLSTLGFVVPILGNCTLSTLSGGAFTQSAAGEGLGNTITVSYIVTGW